MRTALTSLLLFSYFISAYGQTGSISGSIVDEKKQNLAYTTVMLVNEADSSHVGGAISNEAGKFRLEQLKPGKYLIRISNLGYIEVWLKSELTIRNLSLDLGVVELKSSGTELKGIEVEGERKLLENNIDKKVFQVDKSIISQSGSAIDALQQLPNVTMDENGNLQMRGSEGILILINGKPTGITGVNLQTILAQIPANSIEKIEVITNPSSKYDAEGANGIINIILKRTKKAGVTGNINTQVGSRDRYNLSTGLSYNVSKFSLGVTYGLRYNTMRWNGYLDRKLMPSDTVFYFNTRNNGMNRSISQAVSLSADYYFNKKNTLSWSAAGTFGRNENPEWISYFENDLNNVNSTQFWRHNKITSQNTFYNSNAQYKKTYDKPGKELTVSSSFSSSSDTNTLNGLNTYTLKNYKAADSLSDIRQNRSKSYTKNFILQSDFVLPLKNERKLEAGVKSAFRNYDNEMRISKQVNPAEQYFLDSGLSNRFVYSEIINAGYFNYSGVYRSIGFQAGTRIEQTLADGTLKYTGKKVGYHRLDFFPTFYLLKNFKKSQEWKLNYTRRIERPSGGQLNPFSDLSDPRNIRRGNPDLKPQFIHSLELDYTFTGKKFMTNPSVYYKQTNNLMWRYITINEGINYVSFENIGTSYNLGMEWITTFNPVKWFNTLTSLNVFKNRMKGQIGTFTFDNSNVMANIKQTANFKVKKWADFQFTYNFRSPFLSPQGQSFVMHWLDMGISSQVLKNKGTLTLTLSDVFNTRQFGMQLYLPQVEQEFLRKMESRILFVGFNYRFGTSTAPKPKKQNQQDQRQDDMGF